MPDHTNDLRAHALHQKSKEPPEVPRITAEEAIDLRAEASRSIDHDYFHSLLERKLISSWSSLGFHAVAIDVTTLGRAALARYEAEREREIRKPLVDACSRALHLLQSMNTGHQHDVFCNGVHAPSGHCEGMHWLAETMDELGKACGEVQP
ncbi:MAG: hypothetical protein VW405_00890 [Rhodospirillaceae bacterium]